MFRSRHLWSLYILENHWRYPSCRSYHEWPTRLFQDTTQVSSTRNISQLLETESNSHPFKNPTFSISIIYHHFLSSTMPKILSNCFMEDKPISGSPSSQLCLETLVLSVYFNPGLHPWATRWVTRLTTLELHDLLLLFDWTAFSELLVACSNSLSSLHLDTY